MTSGINDIEQLCFCADISQVLHIILNDLISYLYALLLFYLCQVLFFIYLHN